MTDPLETISDTELAETAVIVATVNGNSGIPAALGRRCHALGVPEPLVIVVDHPGDVRRITIPELAGTAVVVMSGDWTDPTLGSELAGRLRDLCRTFGVSPAPLLLTVDHGETVELAVTDKAEAEAVVRYLSKRFGL